MQRRILNEANCRELCKNFSSRAELIKDSALYHKCLKLHILDEIFPRQLTKYDEKRDIAFAKQFKYAWELGKANNAVYQRLQSRGLLDKLFPIKRNAKHDIDECIAIAKTYDYSSDLERDLPGVYRVLSKRGLAKKIFTKSKHDHCDYERCRKAASRFNRKKDFETNAPHEYAKAIAMGWLDELCNEFHYMSYQESQMKSRIANGTSLSDEEIITIAKQYTNSAKFIKDSGVYAVARKRKLLPLFTWMHKKPQGWSDIVYVYEFVKDRVAYIGRTGRPTKRDYEHRNSESDPVFKYAKLHNSQVPSLKILHSNLTLDDGKKKECSEIERYIKDGWTLLNRRAGGGAGNIGYSTSKANALRVAQKYNLLKDLRKDHPKLVQLLYRRGWINECVWLKKINPPTVKRGHWDVFEHVKQEASKYNDAQTFKSKAWGAYDGAVRNCWLDQLFTDAA